MSRGLSESGQATPLVLVGLMVLAIPAGLALAQGLTASSTATDTAAVVTPTLPTVNLTETPTSTPTPTPTPDGDDNKTDGNTTTGQIHFVNAGGGIADGVTSAEGCSGANYTTIQAAVNAAEPGDMVLVCEGTYPEHVEVTTADLTIQADGDASIENAGASAVWINAPGVTLRGFDVSVSGGADYAVEVGGQEAVIRNNTVSSPGVGIFLSDGHTETGECSIDNQFQECDDSPPVDPELGRASKSRISNNTVSADHMRIWSDADQVIIHNNFLTDIQTIGGQSQTSQQEDGSELFFTAGHEDRPWCQGCEEYNSSVVSSGNGTVIRDNTVRTSDPGARGLWYHEAGIQAGKTPREGHNMATNNVVVNNSVSKPHGTGIKVRKGGAETVIRNNTLENGLVGIQASAADTVIRNNDIAPGNSGPGNSIDIMGSLKDGEEVLVINNTISALGRGFGITVKSRANIIGNTIRGGTSRGISFRFCNTFPGDVSGRVVDNRITEAGVAGIGIWCKSDNHSQIEILNNHIVENGNNPYAATGVFISDVTDPTKIEIHNNLINNNGAGSNNFGIRNSNESAIVDATNNIWACGGPSSGFNPLADPYTGRLANGSGDAISAGNSSTRNGHPISNVHFDPFRVQNPSSCSGSQPTPTSTPTLTPTATSTSTPPPTPTPTPTSTAAIGSGNETGGTGGNSTGGNDTGGEGSGGETSGGDEASDGTPSPVTQSPIPTETPPETPTPTPVVEPGFGLGTWALGVALLVSLVALRHRAVADTEENCD